MLLFGLSIFNQFGPLAAVILISITILALLTALTIHEAAHAYMANALGDNTSKTMGRLTLNPLAHLELWGTLMMLLVGFGWGKPVMVNPANFSNPKFDNLTVSLAGPISNFLLAAAIGTVIRLVPMPPIVTVILSVIVLFNLTLMIFNLLPIPPLDGSKVLALFLSETAYLYFQQIGFYILIILIVFSNQIPVLQFILNRVVNTLFTVLTGNTSFL